MLPVAPRAIQSYFSNYLSAKFSPASKITGRPLRQPLALENFARADHASPGRAVQKES